MKIVYKQPEEDPGSSLRRFGIQNCYLKKLSLDRDRGNVTKRTHHHTGFEMHILTEGFQKYEVAGETYMLEGGSFLLIYPNVPHTVLASTPHTQKYSITFSKQPDDRRGCLFGAIDERIAANIRFISEEMMLNGEHSATLIENSILEILVMTFRLLGMKEKENTKEKDENVMVSLAKQYIDDNIEMAPTINDLSEYCYLSAKQLTRIFGKFEGVSPGAYIISRRIARIEALLANHSLSLKQISEIMHFGNEYYFNAFFRKHAGMPPGEYRKTVGK